VLANFRGFLKTGLRTVWSGYFAVNSEMKCSGYRQKINEVNRIFLRGNASSPTEMKNHNLPPVGFSHHFTIWAKHVTK